jgi:hypothetical protein
MAKGNWKNGFGNMFIDYIDAMQRYYLRLTGQAIRQAQVNKSATPSRTSEHALCLYVKGPLRFDKEIPLILRPLNTKLANALE